MTEETTASLKKSKNIAARIMPIVWINGLPGVGKHTISKLLAAKLNDTLGVNTKVVHNHLHIDLASAIVDRSKTSLWQSLRKGLRSIYLNAFSDPDTFENLYILTDFQTSNSLGLSVYKEVIAAAKSRQCLLIPIVLTCSLAENMERITSLSRIKAVEGGKGMLINAQTLKAMKDTYDDGLVGVSGAESNVEAKNRLVLDISKLKAEDSAETVAQWVINVMKDYNK